MVTERNKILMQIDKTGVDQIIFVSRRFALVYREYLKQFECSLFFSPAVARSLNSTITTPDILTVLNGHRDFQRANVLLFGTRHFSHDAAVMFDACDSLQA